MEDNKRRELTKTVKAVLLAEAVLIASNRLLAHLSGGDTQLFDLLLMMAGIAIPLAAALRFLRRARRG